jgi:hypothetical protein
VALELLDDVWIRAAARVGVPVVRGGDAYVHYDGARLFVASASALDADDSLAQLVLHELCHALVQGESRFRTPDWGLDNTTNDDEVREHAAVRLQAHLLGAYGLRAQLYPTTVVRTYYEALPHNALAAANDAAAQLAHVAAARAARAPFAAVLRDALAESAQRLALPPHRRVPLPSGAGGHRCGACVWRTPGGVCRQGAAMGSAARVGCDDDACARFEAALDCQTCGACCRQAYDLVLVSSRDPARKRHPDLIVASGREWAVRREGEQCAALDGPSGGPYSCRIYADRPRTCRDFQFGSKNCLDARRKVGLSF